MIARAWAGPAGQALRRSVGAPYANGKSVRFAGSTTADVGYVNLGQPSAWQVDYSANEIAFTLFARRNGRDGRILSCRTDSSAPFDLAFSGGGLTGTIGGNFLSSGNIGLADATWYFITATVRLEGSTHVGRFYVGNSNVSVANANAGSVVASGIDWLINHRRGANNSSLSFGAYGNHNVDELHVWSKGFTGDDHLEARNGNVAFDYSTHTHGAFLINGYRCGDHADDVSPVLKDYIGSQNGTLINPGNVSFPSEVP